MKALMKTAGTLLTATLLSVSVTLAVIHQFVWNTPSKNYKPLTDVVYLIEGFNGSCSAVMVAPKHFLTAAHCDAIVDPTIEGKKARVIKKHPTEDLMMMWADVEGPWIHVGKAPRIGSNIVSVGWPVGVAELVVPGKMLGVLKIKSGWPLELTGNMILSTQAEGGFSGGGVFQFQDGSWKLIGILTNASATTALAEPVSTIIELLLNE